MNTTFDKHYADIKRGASTENVAADITALTKAPLWFSGIVPYIGIDTTQTMDKGHTGIVITGGNSPSTAQVMPGGDCCSYEVSLPDNWDELIGNQGYGSINNYKLK